MANESISKAGELISGTITNAAKGVGTTISTISDASGLDNIQLAPGLDVEGFANSLKSAPDTGVGATLGKITGLDVSQVLQVPSRAKIKNLIGSYLGGLQEQIALEVRRCIENHLLALLNKIPEINLVLNIEQIITNAIAGERIKIQRKIALDVNKLAFQKLKVQQIALYKQKITEAVRKACPSTSPRNIKLYQGNSLEIIKAAAAVASKTAAEIQEDAEKQAEGFNEDTSEKLTQTPEPEVQKQLGTAVREQPKVEEVIKEEEKIQLAAPPKPTNAPPGQKYVQGLNGWVLVDADYKSPTSAETKAFAQELSRDKEFMEELDKPSPKPIQTPPPQTYRIRPIDPIRSSLNRLYNLVRDKSRLYREYTRRQYIITHNIYDPEFTDITFTYRIPLFYGTWNTNNPGWKDIKQAEGIAQKIVRRRDSIAPTYLIKVEGTDRKPSGPLAIRQKRKIWEESAREIEPDFAKSNSLYTYIENNIELDTQKIQNDRLIEYFKRERTIDRSMNEVISNLKGTGYSKGLCDPNVLDTYFGGVEVSTSHLSIAFEVNKEPFLNTSKKLSSVNDDSTTISDIASSLEGYVRDPRTYEV